MATNAVERWRIDTLRFSFATVESLRSGAMDMSEWVESLSQHFESQLYSPVGLNERYEAIRKSCRSKLDLFVSVQADIVAGKDLGCLRQLNAIVPQEIWPLIAAAPWPLHHHAQPVAMENGLSDGHVHTNGATPLIVTLDVSFTAIHARMQEGSWQAPPLTMRDTNSQRYDLMRVLELAFLLTASVQNLSRGRARRGRSTLMVQYESDRKGFWTTVARHAAGQAEGEESLVLEAMRDEMNEFAPPSVIDALSGLGAELESSELIRYRSGLVDGILICIGLLSHGLMSKTQAPLEDFVRCFNRQANARWNLLGPIGVGNSFRTVETGRLVASLQALSHSGSIERLELRKSVHPSLNFAMSVKEEITQSLQVHLSSVANFLASRGAQMAFQMPLGLLKVPSSTRLQPSGEDDWILRHDLPKYLHVLKELNSFLALNPSMRRYIGSIDVAGFETAVPNWVFALSFRYYAQAALAARVAPLGLTVHAGEQFDRPLEGLRAIWEAMCFAGDVRRIGHGLALDHVLVTKRDYADTFNAVGLLDDLLWSYDLISEHDSAEVWRGRMAPQIEDLGYRIYGTKVTVTALLQAR